MDNRCLALVHRIIIDCRGHIRKVHRPGQHDTSLPVQGQQRLGTAEYITFPVEKSRISNIIFRLHLGDIDFCEIAKTIIEQRYGILVVGGRLVPEHHTDQFQSVPFRTGYHTVTGRIGIAGLDTHQVLISVGPAGQQLYFGIFQLFIGHMVIGQDVQPGRQ